MGGTKSSKSRQKLLVSRATRDDANPTDSAVCHTRSLSGSVVGSASVAGSRLSGDRYTSEHVERSSRTVFEWNITASNVRLQQTKNNFCSLRFLGFFEIYTCISGSQLVNVCSNQVTRGSLVYLTSPSFPEMYPPDQNCSCSIRTQPNYRGKTRTRTVLALSCSQAESEFLSQDFRAASCNCEACSSC